MQRAVLRATIFAVAAIKDGTDTIFAIFEAPNIPHSASPIPPHLPRPQFPAIIKTTRFHLSASM